MYSILYACCHVFNFVFPTQARTHPPPLTGTRVAGLFSLRIVQMSCCFCVYCLTLFSSLCFFPYYRWPGQAEDGPVNASVQISYYSVCVTCVFPFFASFFFVRDVSIGKLTLVYVCVAQQRALIC